MFTGLIQEKAEIVSIAKNKDNESESAIRITLSLRAAALGESIAINGCCLTVSSTDDSKATFYVSPETISRTTLGFLAAGDNVNIERSLGLGDKMGGHFVSGHIDDIGSLLEISEDEESIRLTIGYSLDGRANLIPKGSIAVDGVSLTINELRDGIPAFEVAIIPHTAKLTTFGELRVGDKVNLEYDLLGKFIQRSVSLKKETAAGPTNIIVASLGR